MIFLILFFAITIILYIIIVRKIHDFSYPTVDLQNFKENNLKKVLFIYPHPDDETMSSGGLIHKMSKDKFFNVHVVSITKGECGDEKLKLEPKELGSVREQEFAHALKTLGVSNLEIWSFPDGSTTNHINEIRSGIKKYITKNQINLIVTYEKYGLYGHPDHVLLSEIIYSLKNSNIKVLYSTLPSKILKHLSLPKKLTYKDRTIEMSHKVISDPEFKINITGSIIHKYLAAKKYKSQRLGSKKMPLWLMALFGNYEYYTSKYKKL